MQAYYSDQLAVPEVNPGDPGGTPSHRKAVQFKQYALDRALPIKWCDIEPISWQMWSLVHDKDYIETIRTGRSPGVFAAASVAWSEALAQAQLWAGGSMLGALGASLEQGCALSPTSGFHHAHYQTPGVYCLLNGLVLCAVIAKRDFDISKVLILDCDYHFGNGTEDIIARLELDYVSHRTLGHAYKRPAQADEYLAAISRICQQIEQNQFGLVIYQAGMDVLLGDPAGGGILSYRQTYDRDKRVFDACHQSQTPCIWNFAGGYKMDTEGSISPVLRGHSNTAIACIKVFDQSTSIEPEL
jgi:acetoin utilization deacetylase AcuC-like enzyme